MINRNEPLPHQWDKSVNVMGQKYACKTQKKSKFLRCSECVNTKISLLNDFYKKKLRLIFKKFFAGIRWPAIYIKL